MKMPNVTYIDLAVILTWPQYRCYTKLSIPLLQVCLQILDPMPYSRMTSLFAQKSCTALQIEIFAEEFEPTSYFCEWTCVHLIMRRQK